MLNIQYIHLIQFLLQFVQQYLYLLVFVQIEIISITFFDLLEDLIEVQQEENVCEDENDEFRAIMDKHYIKVE